MPVYQTSINFTQVCGIIYMINFQYNINKSSKVKEANSSKATYVADDYHRLDSNLEYHLFIQNKEAKRKIIENIYKKKRSHTSWQGHAVNKSFAELACVLVP